MSNKMATTSDSENQGGQITIELAEVANDVYHGGQVISGRVNCQLDKEIEMTRITIQLYGDCVVNWSQKSLRHRRTASHFSEETYVNDVIVLWGHEKKADDVACPTESLPAGKHSFPFKVTLPNDIPYSYQTPRGNIRYTLNATIHVPPTTLPLTIAPSAPLLNSTEYNEVQFLTATRGITVCQELILAMFPRYAKSVSYNHDIAISSSCCTSDSFSCCVTLSRNGFVPGEHLNVDLKVTESSKRIVKYINLVLKQIIKHTSSTDSTLVTSHIVQSSYGPCINYDKRHWTNNTMVIPVVPPTSDVLCKYINITYELMVSFHKFSRIAVLHIPITIGSVPIKESVYNFWQYKDCITQPKKCKRKKKPTGQSDSSPPDDTAVARCKVYYIQSPLVYKEPLETSPGFKRKQQQKYLKLQHQNKTNGMESFV